MENNNKTEKLVQIHNLLIIDESGSMSPLHDATLNGVNEVLNTIRQAQHDFAESQKHFVTIVTFDTFNSSHVRTLVDNAPIASVGQFTEYCPGGGTPLFDAIGISLTRLERLIANQDLATAVVTIVTDGMENSSHEYTHAQVQALIKRLTEKGWTFSYMGACHDVKGTADSLAISNSMVFSHNERGTSSSWNREKGSKMAHYRRIDNDIEELRYFTAIEREQRWNSYNSNYYSNRITPEHIDHLEKNEVFVFGSNIHGNHNGAAAAMALQQFGAKMGQAEGPQGASYAIPTTDGLHPLPIDFVNQAVQRFIRYAQQHPDTRFLVTAVGCGNAGLKPEQVAPLFRSAIACENVTLPAAFWHILGIMPS